MARPIEPGSSGSDLVSNITCLTSKKNHEEALRILRRVATMVRPIMKAHGWKINTLAEFYPKGLLGVNINRGWKIQLCLRYHTEETRFLPWEDIIGTMLHELAHNIRGPHDAQFYKALDNLNDEYDKVVASGYTGEGFDSVGHRLGTKHGGFGLGGGGTRLGDATGSGSGTATGATRAAAALAAEKRRQINELMLPAGGQRLAEKGSRGTSSVWEQWYSPRELATLAAERRAQDQVWCGSSPFGTSQESTRDSQPVSSSGTKRKDPDQGQGNAPKDKRPRVHCDPDERGTSIAASTSLSTDTDTGWNEWSCHVCTLVNEPLALQCDCCLALRPH
ncbi:WLM domain-containing protein [Mortierella sp. GBAus27b]|nr:WLM domain-containing protein [Mortierella sp. GBAus27b]